MTNFYLGSETNHSKSIFRKPRITIDQNMEATVLQLGRSCVAPLCQKTPFTSLRFTLRETDNLRGASLPFYLGSARLQVASAPRLNLWKIASCPDPNNIGQEDLVIKIPNAANNHDGDRDVTIRKSEEFCQTCGIYFWEEKEKKKNIWLRTRCSCDGDYLVHEKCLTERALQEKKTRECNTCNEAVQYIPLTLPNPAERIESTNPRKR
ncbi:hypothetical protein CDL12_06022 [Handroanthus impetiginosus]|uniref:RING-CH-type domain-containing protein n=1 Tax=Handroanthus impetiginosus TaxID=429701 RepID=A0A2G9HUU3_9LAMI|nr:hypothetical protein CDL12_06022 [Handroanthus impetiginosus]